MQTMAEQMQNILWGREWTTSSPHFSSGIVERTKCERAWKSPDAILDPNAYGFGNARKVWETLRRSSQNMAIWASERMLFDPTKTCCFCYIYFIANVLYCLAIRTEEIQ